MFAERWLEARLPSPGSRRLVVLTGARQTGKTTLARRVYGGMRYVNLDAVEDRESLRDVRTAAWARTVGPAVLDEAQKEPSVFEKVKYAFDDGAVDFTVLLGSSRFLLLEQVRETLAGRAFLYELWPLTASELRTAEGGGLTRPLLADLIESDQAGFEERLRAAPEVLLAKESDRCRRPLDHLSLWGGMPGLLHLEEDERKVWLSSYAQTYLERDLTDLVRLQDLHPFRTLQRLCMLRTGGLLSCSELARDAQISTSTARRYLEYLQISYQVVKLRPYLRNLTSTVVKAPKLYWVDLGLLRHGTRQWGPLTGPLFETLAVGEVFKLVSALGLDAELFFYRTRSGREVDLVLDTTHGVLGVEFKSRPSAVPSDASPMKALARALRDRWVGGLVVHSGDRLHPLVPPDRIWSVPLHRLV